MTDTVIKGTGNSRSIKSVPNLAALAPTYDKLLEYLTGDGLPVDIGPLDASGVDVEGTSLNKANLLSDALCAALGLDTAATPTEAMEALRTLVATAQSTADGKAQIEAGSYTGTGTVGADNPNSLTFGFVPKLVLISGPSSTNSRTAPFGFWCGGPTMILMNTSTSAIGFATLDGNTLNWYAEAGIKSDGASFTASSSTQLNAGYSYFYVAIG